MSENKQTRTATALTPPKGWIPRKKWAEEVAKTMEKETKETKEKKKSEGDKKKKRVRDPEREGEYSAMSRARAETRRMLWYGELDAKKRVELEEDMANVAMAAFQSRWARKEEKAAKAAKPSHQSGRTLD